MPGCCYILPPLPFASLLWKTTRARSLTITASAISFISPVSELPVHHSIISRNLESLTGLPVLVGLAGSRITGGSGRPPLVLKWSLANTKLSPPPLPLLRLLLLARLVTLPPVAAAAAGTTPTVGEVAVVILDVVAPPTPASCSPRPASATSLMLSVPGWSRAPRLDSELPESARRCCAADDVVPATAPESATPPMKLPFLPVSAPNEPASADDLDRARKRDLSHILILAVADAAESSAVAVVGDVPRADVVDVGWPSASFSLSLSLSLEFGFNFPGRRRLRLRRTLDGFFPSSWERFCARGVEVLGASGGDSGSRAWSDCVPVTALASLGPLAPSLASRFCSSLASFSSCFLALSSCLISSLRAFSCSFCWPAKDCRCKQGAARKPWKY